MDKEPFPETMIQKARRNGLDMDNLRCPNHVHLWVLDKRNLPTFDKLRMQSVDMAAFSSRPNPQVWIESVKDWCS